MARSTLTAKELREQLAFLDDDVIVTIAQYDPEEDGTWIVGIEAVVPTDNGDEVALETMPIRLERNPFDGDDSFGELDD